MSSRERFLGLLAHPAELDHAFADHFDVLQLLLQADAEWLFEQLAQTSEGTRRAIARYVFGVIMHHRVDRFSTDPRPLMPKGDAAVYGEIVSTAGVISLGGADDAKQLWERASTAFTDAIDPEDGAVLRVAALRAPAGAEAFAQRYPRVRIDISVLKS